MNCTVCPLDVFSLKLMALLALAHALLFLCSSEVLLLFVHKAETFTMPELELEEVLMVGAMESGMKELGDGRLMMAVVICCPLQFICARSLGFRLRLERQLKEIHKCEHFKILIILLI